MNTKNRVLVASVAATAGLFLAACDNTETEETPQTPAETTTQMDDGTTTDNGGVAGTDTDTDTDNGGVAGTDTDTDTDN